MKYDYEDMTELRDEVYPEHRHEIQAKILIKHHSYETMYITIIKF